MRAVALTLVLVLAMPLSGETFEMETIKKNVRDTVEHLAVRIGQRSYRDLEKLARTAGYIEDRLHSYGCKTKRQPYDYKGNAYYNIITEVKGTDSTKDSILVIGAHYDTVEGTPGADDNASGVAGLLELARLTAQKPLPRTVRFVAFTLEEPPAYMTHHMGSYVYAESLHNEGAKVHGMISLEMLGYYCDEEGCQYYPASLFKLFYPKTGNFAAFVGNFSSKEFTDKVKTAFVSVSGFPAESLSGVSIIPGVDFSDHRNFWKFGYPAFMITDTAFYRNPNYHDAGDTADTLDYERLSLLVKDLYLALGMM
jgi:Zn-dependent M28 family amino/carboxypeptidase